MLRKDLFSLIAIFGTILMLSSCTLHIMNPVGDNNNNSSGGNNNNSQGSNNNNTSGEVSTIIITKAAARPQSNYSSGMASISSDGMKIAFYSEGDNLTLGDVNGVADVYVADRASHETVMVSVASDGTQADRPSYYPAISGDGNHVAFVSAATNLVEHDANTTSDIFVHNLLTGTTTRVSVATDGTEANKESAEPSISSDGRYVVFTSYAMNLIPEDKNNVGDVFLHDTQTGITTMVSSTLDKVTVVPGNGESSSPRISADGRYVAFMSAATNLVSGDTNGAYDIFVKDLNTGTITRANLSSKAEQANFNCIQPDISADGKYVVFYSSATNLVDGDTNGSQDIFLRDTITSTTRRVSVKSDGAESNGASFYGSISRDGKFIAFVSQATNLVASDTNGLTDVFIHNVQTGVTSLISVSSKGIQGNKASLGTPRLSQDGTYVVFDSDSTNLAAGDTNNATDVFIRNTVAGTTIIDSVDEGSLEGERGSSYSSISSDGRYVAFQSDSGILVTEDYNGYSDIFLSDTKNDTITRVSLSSSGGETDGVSSEPTITPDARYIAFTSEATNLTTDSDTNGSSDVFVLDRNSGDITKVSIATDGTEGDDYSYYPAISADGKFVVFTSDATNLVSNDTNWTTDVFIHNMSTGATARASVASDGTEADGESYIYPGGISSDGRYVAFESGATNLVTGDTNGVYDVFVRDMTTGITTRISVASDGTEGDMDSYGPSVSADGRYIAFYSDASNLVDGDTNTLTDVFVYDRNTSTTTRVSIATDGTEGNGSASMPSISADGRYVAYHSSSSNLVANDTNGKYDVFVYDRNTSTNTMVSVVTDSTIGNNMSASPSMSADGKHISFQSTATNLVAGYNRGIQNIYVRGE